MNSRSLAMLIYAAPAWVRRLIILGFILVTIPIGALSITLTPPDVLIAVWWPAAAFAALAAICSRGHRTLVAVGILGAGIASNLLADRPPLVAIAFGIANAAEAWVIASIATYGQTSSNFQRVTDAGRFIFATLGGALTIAVLVGVISLVEGSENPFYIAGAVAASHASAVLLITPLALLPASSFTTPHRLELLGQVVVLAATIALVFGPAADLPLTFLPFPALGWAAVRFATGVTAAESLGIAVATLTYTAFGGGPFAGTEDWSTQAGLHMLQLFLGIIAGTMLVLGRVRSEREKLVALVDAREIVLRTGITGSSLAFVILEQTSHDAARVAAANDAALELLPSDGAKWQVGDTVVATSFPDLLVAPLRRIMSGEEETWIGEIQDASGLREIEVHLTRIYDSAGGYVVTIQAEDVTAYNFAREADARALANERATVHQLKEANRQKDDFVSAVSHELRTPVTSIVGFSEELNELDLPEPAPEYVAIVSRNAQRLGELVEDLLHVGRMASVKDVGAPEEVNLAALAAEIVDDLQHSWAARDVTVAIETHGVTTVSTVRADLTRILTNLLSNAIKFSPDSGRIEVRLEASTTEFTARITDEGAGIAPEDIDRVFERFYRTESASIIAGTGLGLPIVRDLVEHLGGTVRLESDGHSGTTAVVWLPALPAVTDQ